jgi:hypothetical protein
VSTSYSSVHCSFFSHLMVFLNSFHYHRLLRIHPLSSHLLKSTPADPRNDIDVAHSSYTYLDLSPLSSRLFSGYACHDKDGFGGTSLPASTTLPMPRSRDLVTQQPPYPPCLPHSIGSTSLALAMSPQQSSIPEPQTVSLSHLFYFSTVILIV